MTDSGDVALERVELIMTDLGHVEDEIFQNRHKNEEKYKQRLKREKANKPDFSAIHKSQFAPVVSCYF